jgi:hypothetical protein
LKTQPGLSYFELPAPSADRRVRRFLARGLDDAPDAGPGRAGDDASIRAQKTILPRTGVKWLIMTGSALAVIGQVLLTRLSPHGNYAGEIVPSLILTGLGVGCLFCSAIFGGTVSVRPGDAGIAGALVNRGRRLLPGSSPDLLAVHVPFARDEGSRLPGALEVAGGGDREVRGEHRRIEVSVVLDAGLARLSHHCSIGVEGAQNLGVGQ